MGNKNTVWAAGAEILAFAGIASIFALDKDCPVL
jgi:hypothetical protein